MAKQELLLKIEGLQTVETVQEELGYSRQSAINLLSELRKKGYVRSSGGRQQVRLYKITMRKQRKREDGMFDIINRYSPMKVMEWYDHQVHGKYTVEDVIVDAIQTKSFRLIMASLRLFNHVKDWSRLYNLAKGEGVWQKVGAMYDVARMHFRVRKMPEKYRKGKFRKWMQISRLRDRGNFPMIQKMWKVYIPFNEKDLREIK